MGYINKNYGRKVMLFIDEYDVPIQEGYLHKGNPTHIHSLGMFEEPNTRFGLSQHKEMIVIIRNLLTAALKDNLYVEKSLITGILRVAKESNFSGLNNLEVNTILRYNFNDKFGFTEKEVEELVNYYNAEENIEIIKKWNEEVKEALNQIEENRYQAELQDRNVTNIWKLAIVFKGKRVEIVEGLISSCSKVATSAVSKPK